MNIDIATIRQAMNDQLDVYEGLYGASNNLTPAQGDTVTDGLANVLNTVSPTGTTYPPVKL